MGRLVVEFSNDFDNSKSSIGEKRVAGHYADVPARARSALDWISGRIS